MFKKRILPLLAFISFLLTAAQGFADSDFKIDGEKIYLDSFSQVIVNNSGIFFCADGEFYRTESVYYDDKGFYVPVAPMYWVCKNGHINPIYVYPCPKCGAGLPGT